MELVTNNIPLSFILMYIRNKNVQFSYSIQIIFYTTLNLENDTESLGQYISIFWIFVCNFSVSHSNCSN